MRRKVVENVFKCFPVNSATQQTKQTENLKSSCLNSKSAVDRISKSRWSELQRHFDPCQRVGSECTQTVSDLLVLEILQKPTFEDGPE